MATPHVTGLVLYLLSLEGISSSAIPARLTTLSTKDKVTSPGTGSPNRILYNGNGA
jgi:oryzin